MGARDGRGVLRLNETRARPDLRLRRQAVQQMRRQLARCRRELVAPDRIPGALRDTQGAGQDLIEKDILRTTVTKSLGLLVDERPARRSSGGVDGVHDGLLAVGT